MFPMIPNNMNYYTGSSPAYAGSSPYAIPDQPPFYDLTRQSRRPSPSTTTRPSISFENPRKPSTSSTSSTSSSRRPSIFSLRGSSSPSRSQLRRSSSSLLTKYNSTATPEDLERHSSTSSTSSLSGSIKSFFRADPTSREEKAARKAEKERKKQVDRAERAAYERAQEMEATALYMAWRYGDGPNTVSYCMY